MDDFKDNQKTEDSGILDEENGKLAAYKLQIFQIK